MSCAARSNRYDRMPGPERDPAMRVGDDERRRTVGVLRDNVGSGHLDFAEYEARVTRTLAAQTRGDLDAVVVDLPRRRPGPRRPDPVRRQAALLVAIRIHVILTVVTAAVTVTVWLATGAGHPWPVYPISGIGTALLVLVTIRRSTAVPAGTRRVALSPHDHPRPLQG